MIRIEGKQRPSNWYPTTLSSRKEENAPLGAKRSLLLKSYRGLLFDSSLGPLKADDSKVIGLEDFGTLAPA